MKKMKAHIAIVLLLMKFISAKAQYTMPDTVCVGATRTYKVNNASIPSTYTWKIDSIVQSSTKNEMIVTWSKPGKFLLTVQEHSASGCDGEIQSGYVYVIPGLQGVRYSTITANANVAKQLHARDIGYSYHWQPSTGLNFNDIKSPVFQYDKSMQYFINISLPGGCEVTDTLKVLVTSAASIVPSVYVPNAFTPNNDGINDKLFPITTGIKEISFRVFNRWGQVVFETNQINHGWDGSYKGVMQSTGVYVWKVKATGMDGMIYQQSGTAVLIR